MMSSLSFSLALALFMLSGCAHQMTMKSPEGLTYDGRSHHGTPVVERAMLSDGRLRR